MAEPIVVLTETADEAFDLAVLLTRHGLPTRVTLDGVEVSLPREDTNLLLSDLAAALATWLDDRGVASTRLRVGDRVLVYDHSGRYAVEAEDPPLSLTA